MSLQTSIANARMDLKIRSEVANAQIQSFVDSMRKTPAFGVMFALAFVMLLAAIAIGPAQAGTLNDSISPLINDMADLFTPILNLVIKAVPVIIASGMIGFILGVLAAILSKLHL